MSEPIPESIPTSTSRLSHRPTKRIKSQHNSAISSQSHSLAVLFANADREIVIPPLPSKATSTSAAASLASAPEIVPNVQGSSAGAGSGEFHVYKASRRREYERLKAMDEEVKREEDEKAWEQRKSEAKAKEEKRMGKNKARREKAKERKALKGKDKEKDGGKEMEGVRVDGGEGPLVEGAAEVPIVPDEGGLTIHDEDD